MGTHHNPSLDRLTALIVATVGAAHASWIWRDGRLPVDLGQYYTDIPALFSALEAGDLGVWAQAWLEPGGWYQATLAAWLALVGRSAAAFRTPDVLWLCLVLAGVAWLVRREWGSAAALLTASTVGVLPLLVGVARTSWIHLPESALVVGLAVAAQADPTLAYRRTAAIGALGAGLAVALRPSGLVWAPTTVLLCWPALRSPHRWRLLAPVAGLAVGLAIQAPGLGQYMEAKAAARSRYLEQVPALAAQIQEQVGLPLLGFAMVGLVAAAVTLRGRLAALFALWGTVPLGLVLLTAVGVDNFPLWMPALLALAAAGLARRLPVVLSAATALTLFVTLTVPQFLPSAAPGTSLERWVRRAGLPSVSGPQNPYRPWSDYGARTVAMLVGEACPAAGTCSLVADQGLVAPYVEEPGRLGLFLLEADEVELHWLAEDKALPDEVHALITWSCPNDAVWRARFPFSQAKRDQLIAAWRLEVAWQAVGWGSCSLAWLAPPIDPSGEVVAPEELPVFERPIPPPRERIRPGRSRKRD